MQMTSPFTMMFWPFFASLVLACACGRATERASRVGEVTGYGGATAYEDATLKTFGGSVGYRFHRRFLVHVEFDHQRGTASQTLFGATVSGRVSRSDVLGALNVLFPIGNRRPEPYITVGGGFSHRPMTVVQVRLPRASQPSLLVLAKEETTPALLLGGGMRYYVSKRWGLRPEVLAIGGLGSIVPRISLGVFYQFGR